MAEQSDVSMVLWVGESVKAFVDAIAEQSEYADSSGLMWDRFGGLTMYACSVYGLSTLFVALVLNRTAIIASTNSLLRGRGARSGLGGVFARREWLKLVLVTLLRLLAVATLAASVWQVMVALSVKAQFEPANLVLRLTRWIPLQYVHYDPLLYEPSDYMAMPRDEVRFGPTATMLWPIFWSVSYSLFVETFSSAINGVKPFLEGGITLFELSLAFQEMSSGFFFLREHTAAKRPSELVLMVSLFLLADHIVNQLGALLYQNKYRLIPLTFLNVGFVWYFVSCFAEGPEVVLSFPFNLIVTYLGLVLVLFTILVCFGILVLAVLVKCSNLQDLNYASLFLDGDESSEFFSKHLNVSLRQDFYTAVINIGLFAITLAGKTSYITEFTIMNAPERNWLEADLWAKVQAAFGVDRLTVLSLSVQSGKVLNFLKENELTGYGNIISSPPERLTIGSETSKPNGEEVSTFRVKMTYLKEIAARFGQLTWSLVYKSFIRQVIPKAFRKYVLRKPVSGCSEGDSETDQEFEARKATAPAFIQHLLTKREKKVVSAGFNLSSLTEEELQTQYAQILAERDLADVDDSPDFDYTLEVVDLEYESESDVESIDLDQGQVVRASGRTQTYGGSPISELLTSDAFLELVDNHDILERHLHYENSGHGTLTRSRYRALRDPETVAPQDESAALLQLLLSTRHQIKKPPSDFDDDDDIDPRLACVICQVKPREIITWPCKCFAICESCRLSLATKGMEGCVCCRRDVEGVLKVFLP